MTVFYGARDDVEIAVPRPWLLVVRRIVQITLGVVCGAEFVLLLWVILP